MCFVVSLEMLRYLLQGYVAIFTEIFIIIINQVFHQVFTFQVETVSTV